MTSSDDTGDVEAADGDIEAADRRNGEPGATDWTETDEPAPSGEPAPSDAPELDTDPDDGQLPSDTDVQAERQP